MANPKQEIKYTKLFINNEFVDAVSGKKFPAFNPATGEKIADVAEGDKADVDLAVAAAKKAFHRNSVWRKMSASDRSKLMLKLAELIERDRDIIASIESLDNGKTFKNACNDVFASAAILRYYAGFCDKITGDTVPALGTLFSMTRKEPVGVVGQIIPWNYPVMMAAWKWAPALATGCTSVLKPAEQTPLSALYVASLVKEAGFPPGAINVITGYGPTAGGAISSHMDIQKVAFTGSTEIGKLIMETAAKSNLKRVSLELGGKSPLVIFDDYDVDEAAKLAYAAVFENHGQCCCAGTRTFVHEKIYDEFVKKATELALKRRVGSPFENDTDQGPQIDKEMYTKVLGYIESGKQEGAKLECGGKAIGKTGYFIEPTVFSNVTDNMKIAREEIFGPVQSIFKFKTLEEVIDRANDTIYGLASGIITKDINKAIAFSQAVEAGTVWVNCFNTVVPTVPFGGYKLSGLGRELAREGLDSYLETKTITMNINVTN